MGIPSSRTPFTFADAGCVSAVLSVEKARVQTASACGSEAELLRAGSHACTRPIAVVHGDRKFKRPHPGPAQAAGRIQGG